MIKYSSKYDNGVNAFIKFFLSVYFLLFGIIIFPGIDTSNSNTRKFNYSSKASHLSADSYGPADPFHSLNSKYDFVRDLVEGEENAFWHERHKWLGGGNIISWTEVSSSALTLSGASSDVPVHDIPLTRNHHATTKQSKKLWKRNSLEKSQMNANDNNRWNFGKPYYYDGDIPLNQTKLNNFIKAVDYSYGNILPDPNNIDYPGYDGWYNNLMNPSLGSKGSNLLRQSPASYADDKSPYEIPYVVGVDGNTPNPYAISSIIFSESISAQQNTAFNSSKSVLFLAFTMHLLNEIMNAREAACPREMIKVLRIPSMNDNNNNLNWNTSVQIQSLNSSSFLPDPSNHQDAENIKNTPSEKTLYRGLSESEAEQIPFHQYTIYKRVAYDPTSGLSINNPRIPINKVSSFIDGGSVYGDDRMWAQFLRSFTGGTLKSRNNIFIPSNGVVANDQNEEVINPPVQWQYPELNHHGLPMINQQPPFAAAADTPFSYKRLMVFGDDRTNESPLLMTMGVLWFRWHNYLAGLIAEKHPEWLDEQIFNEARKWVVAVYQKITFYDWLPILLGLQHNSDIPPSYQGYKSALSPAISVEFEALASQFYMTLVPSTILLSDVNDCLSSSIPDLSRRIRLCNAYWWPEQFYGYNRTLDNFILGMTRQRTHQTDHKIVPDFKEFFYGKSNGVSRSDNVVENLLHVMDVGLPNYNVLRSTFGLKPYETFRDFLNDNKHLAKDNKLNDELVRIYSDIRNLDGFTGGMLESNEDENKPGALFNKITLDEFVRIRDSDRYWFENSQNKLFTPHELSVLRNITLRDVIFSVTNIPINLLQTDVFRISTASQEVNNKCPPFDFSLPLESEEVCIPTRLIDYFEGSRLSFTLSFTMIGIFIATVFIVMLLWTRFKEKAALKHMECTPSVKCRDSNITAEEWMKNDEFCPVCICFNQEQLTLNIYSEKKEPYSRAIKFRLLTQIEIYFITKEQHLPYLFLFKIPDEYDHVFSFKDELSFTNFKYEIERFSEFAGVKILIYELPKCRDLFEIAFTKKDREKQLDRFFKMAFSMAFTENFDNSSNHEFMEKLNNQLDISNKYSDVHVCPFRMTLHAIYGIVKSLPTLFKDKDEKRLEIDRSFVKAKIIEKNDRLSHVQACELTRTEFCEALSLKEGSKFVENMFTLVDKDANGKISFKEFFEFIIIFSKGSAEQKARVIFDMYDPLRNGYLSKQSFVNMLESFIELSNIKPDHRDLSYGLENMFNDVVTSKDNKQTLDFEDFLSLMGDHKDNLNELHINWEGIKECIPKKKRKKREFTENNTKLKSRRTIIKGGDRKSTNKTIRNSLTESTDTVDHNNNNTFDTSFDQTTSGAILDDEDVILDKFFHRNTTNVAAALLRKKMEDFGQSLLEEPNSNVLLPPITPSNSLSRQRIKSPRNLVVGNDGISGKVSANTNHQTYKKKRLSIKTYLATPPTGKLSQIIFYTIRYVENYRWHIFWLTLYTLTVIGIFLEKALIYSTEKEHTGLRRIVGYGGALSRGSASALMFCYSTILLTMCRNIITFCRETYLGHVVPFDAAVFMHKYIATLGLLFTVTHVLGHSLNFYHLSTQSPDDLLCMARSFYHLSDESPKFHTWLYGTITGLSGIILICLMTFIYVFALQRARRYLFNMFWKTHNLYIIFYFVTFIHGLGMMLQMSIFHLFFIGPMILFTIDKLISLARKKAEIPIVRADVLPSNVTNLIFKRPPNFEYKSGQYVRIALTSQGTNEYHPFTLTSAPHEEFLSLHIRAAGPWTNNLRRTYDTNFLTIHPSPKILLDGPFGEGHQDWNRFQVSVLIGGGIGVTPFASILKDIVYKSRSGVKMKCQKVYFLWITRTQKQFEWLTDIIKGVEEKDLNNFVSVNIFITQLHHKFDIRTAMLYICERHFYKVNDRSLFTGLKAVTHFGRPDFISFFMSLQDEHPEIYKFGVFSCGPPAMTYDVEKGTQEMNKHDRSAFIHHYENF